MTCGKIVTKVDGGQEEKIDHDCNPYVKEEFQAQSLSGMEIGVHYQECPNATCQRFLQKDGSCNEITCRCGTHYCYTCGAELQPPYEGHWDWFGDGCQQYGPRRRRLSKAVSFEDERSVVIPQQILAVAEGAPSAWHIPPPPERMHPTPEQIASVANSMAALATADTEDPEYSSAAFVNNEQWWPRNLRS